MKTANTRYNSYIQLDHVDQKLSIIPALFKDIYWSNYSLFLIFAIASICLTLLLLTEMFTLLLSFKVIQVYITVLLLIYAIC